MDKEANGYFSESVEGLLEKIIHHAQEHGNDREAELRFLRSTILGVIKSKEKKYLNAIDQIEDLQQQMSLDADSNTAGPLMILTHQMLANNTQERPTMDNLKLKMYASAISKVIEVIKKTTDFKAIPSKNYNVQFEPNLERAVHFASKKSYLEAKELLAPLHRSGIMLETDFNELLEAYFLYPGKKIGVLKDFIKIDPLDKNELEGLFFTFYNDWKRSCESDPLRDKAIHLRFELSHVICKSFDCYEYDYGNIETVYKHAQNKTSKDGKAGKKYVTIADLHEQYLKAGVTPEWK